MMDRRMTRPMMAVCSRTLLGLAVLLLLVGSSVLAAGAQTLRVGQPAPEVAGDSWINSEPLIMAGLRGRVVLVEFWTYG